MTLSLLLLRVARTLAQWYGDGDPEWRDIAAARAVLEALKEPTAEMIAAGQCVPYPEGVWRAMIAAALGEGT